MPSLDRLVIYTMSDLVISEEQIEKEALTLNLQQRQAVGTIRWDWGKMERVCSCGGPIIKDSTGLKDGHFYVCDKCGARSGPWIEAQF